MGEEMEMNLKDFYVQNDNGEYVQLGVFEGEMKLEPVQTITMNGKDAFELAMNILNTISEERNKNRMYLQHTIVKNGKVRSLNMVVYVDEIDEK